MEHEGNIRFHQVVRNFVPVYIQSKKGQKSLIVRMILEEVTGYYHGRFLKKVVSGDGNHSYWYDAGKRAAREKVGHALRDAVAAAAKRKIDRIPESALSKGPIPGVRKPDVSTLLGRIRDNGTGQESGTAEGLSIGQDFTNSDSDHHDNDNNYIHDIDGDEANGKDTAKNSRKKHGNGHSAAAFASAAAAALANAKSIQVASLAQGVPVADLEKPPTPPTAEQDPSKAQPVSAAILRIAQQNLHGVNSFPAPAANTGRSADDILGTNSLPPPNIRKKPGMSAKNRIAKTSTRSKKAAGNTGNSTGSVNFIKAMKPNRFGIHIRHQQSSHENNKKRSTSAMIINNSRTARSIRRKCSEPPGVHINDPPDEETPPAAALDPEGAKDCQEGANGASENRRFDPRDTRQQSINTLLSAAESVNTAALQTKDS